VAREEVTGKLATFRCPICGKTIDPTSDPYLTLGGLPLFPVHANGCRQTFNRGDTKQTRQDLERVRRDKDNNPGAVPSAFIDASGNTVSAPGDLAPYARVLPFPTIEQDYGVQEQNIGFVSEQTSDSELNTLPILNVEDWRFITFTLRYTAGADDGQLAVTPLYGDSDEFPLPRMIAGEVTPDGMHGQRIMYQEQFLTPELTASDTFSVKMVFDVSFAKVFALAVHELNQSITCNPDGDPPNVCSKISLRYSLSM
jgi:hypothetical protein